MILVFYFLLNDADAFQEEEMTNTKNWNKPHDGTIVCLYPVRLTYMIHVFLYQEKREVPLGKCLVKRQMCSQDKFGSIYVQSSYFFILYDGRLPNDHDLIQEV